MLLPPPLQFQEPVKTTVDFMSQHTYGDYETLSPDAGYTFNVKPGNTCAVERRLQSGSHPYGYQSNNDVKGYSYQPKSGSTNGNRSMRYYALNQTNQFINKAYSIVRHNHQYSTEL